MEQSISNILASHTVRLLILATGIGLAIVLGHFRPEWKSRKTVISWVWTIAAMDIMLTGGEFATSLSAQMFIAGALILNIINFVGDRIENIKFKDFSASLTTEKEYNSKHSILKNKKPEPEQSEPEQSEPEQPKKTNKKKNKFSDWPDGEGENK